MPTWIVLDRDHSNVTAQTIMWLFFKYTVLKIEYEDCRFNIIIILLLLVFTTWPIKVPPKIHPENYLSVLSKYLKVAYVKKVSKSNLKSGITIICAIQ